MCNYYKVHKWHNEYSQETTDEREVKFNRSYIKQKLDSGLGKLWMVRTITYTYIYIYIILLFLHVYTCFI